MKAVLFNLISGAVRGWLGRYGVYVLAASAAVALMFACWWLYDRGRRAERIDWEASTAIAQKEELEETVKNQKEAHEIRTINANRSSGDAWRMLVQNWSR